MAVQRKSVAGKKVPGEKRVPGALGGKKFSKKDQPTKRQRKLATVKNPGADDKEKGIVREEGGNMEWKDDGGEQVIWIPAVYHNDIRGKLLAKASNDGQLVYDHPRRHGYLPNDETAFLASQQHWGAERSLWHHIPNDLLNRLDRLDHKSKDYELAYMYDEDTNKIVLDIDNHPVVDYEDIPSVLSSNFGVMEEGFLLEAIKRIDSRIERRDFLARMPWERKSKESGKVEPIFTLSTIGNREYRWRKDNAIVAWTQRSGSKNLKAYIVSKLSKESRTSNTTRELANGLTREEKEEAERPNKGKMMSRAGKRLLPDEVRMGRENKPMGMKKQRETERYSTKWKATPNFHDGIDDEDKHVSQHLPQHDQSSNACGHKPLQRNKVPARTKSLRKRKAPKYFDSDTDIDDHEPRHSQSSPSNLKSRNYGPQSTSNQILHPTTSGSAPDHPHESHNPHQDDLLGSQVHGFPNHSLHGLFGTEPAKNFLEHPDFTIDPYAQAGNDPFYNEMIMNGGLGETLNATPSIVFSGPHLHGDFDTDVFTLMDSIEGFPLSSGPLFPDDVSNFTIPPYQGDPTAQYESNAITLRESEPISQCQEDFVPSMEVNGANADADGEPAADDELFNEFTTGLL